MVSDAELAAAFAKVYASRPSWRGGNPENDQLVYAAALRGLALEAHMRAQYEAACYGIGAIDGCGHVLGLADLY